jgi:hypothetical protein
VNTNLSQHILFWSELRKAFFALLQARLPQFPKHWQKTISDNGGGADGLTPPMDDGDD